MGLNLLSLGLVLISFLPNEHFETTFILITNRFSVKNIILFGSIFGAKMEATRPFQGCQIDPL